MTLTPEQYANIYSQRFGWHLIPLEPRKKFTKAEDWGNNAHTSGDFWAKNPDWNMGLALGPSRMCSLDIDNADAFAMILEEYGLPADSLADMPTIRGRGDRIMFRVPEGVELTYCKLDWPREDDPSKRFTVFELRASDSRKQRLDVLPPSIHPDTGAPYAWTVQPPKGDWPEPPDWLLAIWTAWDRFKPQFKDVCPWAPKPESRPHTRAAPSPQGEKPSVIDAYCAAHDVTIALERYGYQRKGRRYLSPHSGTGLPGVVIMPDGRAWIHHASDPLCSDDSGQPVNAFDLYCYYEHGGDPSKAVKAAAEMLGMDSRSHHVTPDAPDGMIASNWEPPEDDYTTEPETEPKAPAHATHSSLPFRCLGLDEGHYYYLPRVTQQVTCIPAAGHSNRAHMLTLAPLEWYESTFPTKQGADWLMATNTLMRWSEIAGTFDSTAVRGRGAWFDAGRSVLHLGDRLLVDGADVGLADHSTRYIYERKPPLEALRPKGELTDSQARMLLEVTGAMNWQKPVDGILLAGFLALAPICGAMSWRPHIWLTGQRGSGKSWAIENIVTPVLGAAAISVTSSSTEAGIRQRLKHDARPVVFDEAEGESQSARQRMQAVLELARQASSDGHAEIAKGTAGGKALTFRVRSMFLMGSINVGLAQASDKSRFTVLSMAKAKQGVEGRAQFEALERVVNATLSPEFCAALRARTYRLIPVIRKNSRAFAKAAAEHIGNQRAGDQLGALLAGAWALSSSELIDQPMAAAYVASQDWGAESDESVESDELALLHEILHAQVQFDTKHGRKTRSVAELAQRAADLCYEQDYSAIEANEALSRHGVKYSDKALLISESHPELRGMLRNTPWGGGWGRILERLPGASRMTSIRFSGIRNRAISVPLDSIPGISE